jgi:putative hydrolase of the HAD superfamily
MSRLIPDGVQALFFDAVGTILHPHPPASVVYAEVGRRQGSRLDESEIALRFRTAFQRQEELDRAAGWRTSEEREVARWRNIVGHVLYDSPNPEACFQKLWDHFSRPSSWRVEPDTTQVLSALRRSGYELGVASNFDHRLCTVAAGLPEFKLFAHIAVSAELTWRKPAREFFAALSTQTSLGPGRILVVGDDRINDYEGARAACMHAILVDPAFRYPEAIRIERLAELHES